MDANEYPIRRHKLESLNLTVTWTDDDGTAINLTGYTPTFKVYDRRGGNTVATLTSGSGITVTAGTGQLQIDRSPAQISAWKLTSGKGAYDLSLQSTSGYSDTVLLKGTIEVVST